VLTRLREVWPTMQDRCKLGAYQLKPRSVQVDLENAEASCFYLAKELYKLDAR
jgi:hypothetical protein